MKRRKCLIVICIASITGCLGNEAGQGPSTTTDSADSDIEKRVIECEKQVIRQEIVTRDDETITDPLEPEVLDNESRSEGAYLTVETRFGTTRSSSDEPDEHLDHVVTAYYLVSATETYRTENADADPRHGTALDC